MYSLHPENIASEIKLEGTWRTVGRGKKKEMGKRRQMRREDEAGGAGGNRKECQANHLTKEAVGEMEGRGTCCCGQHSAMSPWVYL